MNPKIVKGDTVEIISGDDKGHRGEVQRVIKKKNEDGSYDPNRVYVLVAGANLVIKHQGRTGRVRTQTGRIEMEAPIHISNVMLLGSEGKPTRAAIEVDPSGDKHRVQSGSRDPLPRPRE